MISYKESRYSSILGSAHSTVMEAGTALLQRPEKRGGEG